jgi:hypothetical protein
MYEAMHTCMATMEKEKGLIEGRIRKQAMAKERKKGLAKGRKRERAMAREKKRSLEEGRGHVHPQDILQ